MRIETTEELERIIEKSNQIIICGAGNIGKIIVGFIRQMGWGEKVICFGVKNRMDNPPECHGLPVYLIKSLRHFSSTALFVVAVGERYRDEIHEDICNNNVEESRIVELNTDLLEEIKDSDINKNSFDVPMLLRRIDQISRLIEMQGEVSFVNRNAFEGMNSCFKERDIVVVGTGPTLKYYKPIKHAIHIGVNGAWKRDDINLDYYFIQDGDRRYIECTSEGLKKGVPNAQKIYLARFLSSNNNWYYKFPEEFYEMDERIVPFYSGGLREDFYRGNIIYTDIRFHPLMEFGSVIFPAIHFALYTCPKRLFLVGCDASIGGHFYDDLNKRNDEEEHDLGMKLGYAAVADFADFNYPETEIISMNPVALKGLFTDTYSE